MACELCEHCQSPITRNDKISIREGFSYHKACDKCYVCSETNLANAEVFKGVIFCSSCSQRIFQGCSTARRTKTKHSSRNSRRTRSKSHSRVKRQKSTTVCTTRREWVRKKTYDEKRLDGSRDGVIERARLVGSNTDSEQEQKDKKPSNVAASDTLQDARNKHVETVNLKKKDLSEIGTTTDVVQELLKKINSLHPEYTVKPSTPPVPPVAQLRRRHSKKKDIDDPVPTCTDLRIAELGMSTEIANMALRKNSEVPVTVRSDTRFKGNPSYTVSLVHIKSDKSDVGRDWLDSAYSTIEESESSAGSLMDRRLGSILKMPIKLFKKNILKRSSLVSILMSTENGRSINIFRAIRRLLREEVVQHQAHGIKKLYSTINRRNGSPYKLGWVKLADKVSRDSNFCCCSYGERCKHYKNSHSYRCMRAQVMKLAGPTASELSIFRSKVKKFLMPQFLRNVLTNCKAPAMKLSAACQKSFSNKTQVLAIK